jgi:hypothetical protein
MGSLPDRLAVDAHSLRCRRCASYFRMGAGAGQAREARLSTDVEVAVAAPAFRRDGFFSGADDGEPAMDRLGPGDSHYELTFTLGEPSGESELDWPTASGESGDDEGRSGEVVAPRSGAEGSADPWSYRLIASSSRLLVLGGLGFAALALLLLGFLLVRTLASGPISGSTTLALVASSIAAIAFLFITFALAALNVLLVDVARNLRWLRSHAERETGIVRG